MHTLLWTASSLAKPPVATDASPGGMPGLGGVWRDDCQCWRDVAWGRARWFDPGVGRVLAQDLDFFPVDREQRCSPLILYAHPPDSTKTICPASGPLYAGLVQAARSRGFSVASIEYRHPARDGFIPAPQSDVAQARRWVDTHAEELGIDPDNVFFAGHARATLALWTARFPLCA